MKTAVISTTVFLGISLFIFKVQKRLVWFLLDLIL